MSARAIGAVALGVVLLCLAATGVYAVPPKQLVGQYTIAGIDSDGKRYEGTAEITHEKGKTVKTTATYKNYKRKDIGLGRVQGDKLIVTFQRANLNTKGTAEYTIRKDGSLSGTWEETNAKGAKFTGTETLTPKK